MNEVALQKQIEELESELRLSGEFTNRRLLDMKAEMDRLKLELTVLARFLEREMPSFTRDFQSIREEVFQEVDPEID